MTQLAIVFFHMGRSAYQWHNLDLAVKRNPGGRVVLLTDSPGDQYPEGVLQFDISSFNSLMREFAQAYIHRNTMTWQFEYRSLVRWLVYNEWWKSNREYGLFVADSDVMIFSDLSKEVPRWMSYAHTLSMGTAGGQSYWFDPTRMEKLVEIMWDVYRNPRSDRAWRVLGHYDKLQREGKPGGVCDMTFLAELLRECPDGVGETTAVVNRSTYDHNILMDQGYYFDGGRKVVEWVDGCPQCRQRDGNTPVRFHTLHMSCSGGMVEGFYKKAMGE
jgi:hypothetical protein